MSQRIVTRIQLLNHHDKPSSYVSDMPARAPVLQQKQQQQKARPLNIPASLRRPHHRTWTLFKDLPLIDAARNPDQRPRYSKEANAVVQVHASLRNKMLPPGPLDGSAELIYMTNIARSNAPGQSPDPEKDTDELMFMLEHRPETIRFWIDERPVGHPNVSKEIRRGVLDDSRNCSVIKVCLNGGHDPRPSREGPSLPKESDIYLPPSTRAARVWIYLDPNKRQDGAKQAQTTLDEKGKVEQNKADKSSAGAVQRRVSLKKSSKPPQKSSPASLQHQPEKVQRKVSQNRGIHPQEKLPSIPSTKVIQKPTQARQAPASYGIPIPTRRSSKKATQRSPLSTNPPATISPGPPELSRTERPTENREVPSMSKAPSYKPNWTRRSSSTARRADPDSTPPSKYQAREDAAGDSEPEDFKNDVLGDISRLMTNSDAFGRFHSSFPETIDSEEERDYFPTSPLDGMPTLGQAQLGRFYKAGRRAQSSIFFGEEALDRKIEVSHVEKPEVKRDFAKPSRIRRLRMTLTGGWLRRANHK